MSHSDRPSGPIPDVTPAQGYSRIGLVYIDDSQTALQTMRRALYPHGLLIETYSSLDDFAMNHKTFVSAALLDVDLGNGHTGLEAAREIAALHSHARIAFITADRSPMRTLELASHGPIFEKSADLSAVVAWIISLAKELREMGRFQRRPADG